MAELHAVLSITDNMTPALKSINSQLEKCAKGLKSLEGEQDNYSKSLDSSKVKEFKNSQDDLNNSADQGSGFFSKLGASVKNAISMFAGMKVVQGVMNTVTGSISSAIGRIDTMDTFQRKMEMITGSSEQATSALDQLRDITKGTAFGLDVAAAGVQNFVTRGMSTQDAVNSINVWSNAVSAFGQGTNAELETVMDALGKMRTKGTIEMEQMSRLFDIGINPIEDYAKATGRTASEVQADLTAKKITTEEFLSTVEKAYQEGTNGVINVMNQGKLAGTTWVATMDNMRAACTRGMVNIIESVDNAFKVLNDNGLKGLIAEYGIIFEKVATGVSSAIAQVLPPIIEFIGTIINKFRESEGSFAPLIANFESIRSSILNMWNQIQPPLTEFVLKLAELISKYLPVFINLITGVQSALFGLLSVIAPPIFNVILAFGNWILEHEALVTTALVAIGSAILAYKTFTAITGIIEGVSAALLVMSSSAVTAKTAVIAYNVVTKAMSAVTGAMTAVQTAFNLVLDACPLMWIPLAIAAVVGAIIWLWNTQDWFRNLVLKCWDAIKNGLGSSFDWLVNVFTKVIPDALKTCGDFFSSVWSGVTGFFEPVISVISTFATFLKNSFIVSITVMEWARQQFIGQLLSWASWINDNFVQPVISFFYDLGAGIVSAWNGIIAFINTVYLYVQQALYQIASWINSNVVQPVIGFFTSLWNGIVYVWTQIFTFFETVRQNIISALSSIWEWIYTNVVSPILLGFQTFYDGLMAILTPVIEVYQNFFSAIVECFTGIYDAYVTAYEAILSGSADVGSVLSTLYQSIRDCLSGIWQAFLEWGNSLWQILSSLGMRMLEAGRDIVNGLWQGIKEKWESFKNWVGETFDGIVGFVKGIFGINSPSTVFSDIGGFLIEGLKNGIETMFNGFYGFFQGIGQKIIDFFSPKDTVDYSEMIDKTKAQIEELNAVIDQGYASIRFKTQQNNELMARDTIEIFQSLVRGVIEETTNLANSLVDELSKSSDGYQKVFEDLRNVSLDELNRIREDQTAVIIETVDQMRNALNALVDGYREILGTVSQESLQTLTSFNAMALNQVQIFIDEITQTFEILITNTVGIFNALTEEAINSLNVLYFESQQVIETLRSNLIRIFSDAINTIIDENTRMSAQLVGIYTQMSTLLIGIISLTLRVGVINAWNQIKNETVAVVTQMAQLVIQTFQNMINAVLTLLRQSLPELKRIGIQMMQELNSGISSQIPTVLSTTSKLVQQLKDTFIKGLGIHSPSRVMYWIGEMMAQGLINGLNADQIKQFVKNTIKDMRSSFERGSFDPYDTVDFLKEDTKKLITYLIEQEGGGSAEGLIYPVQGRGLVVNSPFGARWGRAHEGVDLQASHGDGILSALAGTVSVAGNSGGYGTAVYLDHGNGIQTRYGHMIKGSLNVSRGQTVRAGQKLGGADSTGNSTGDHLHFEIRKNGVAQNPLPYLQGASVLVGDPLVTALEQALQVYRAFGSGPNWRDQARNARNVNYDPNGGVEQWRDTVLLALSMLNLPLSGVTNVLSLMQGESGGRNIMQQIHDINSGGNEARGLMQVTPQTFARYKIAGHDDIWNPLDNILASLNYQMQRYGYLKSTPGYATGTMNATKGLHWVGENGPELMAFRGGEIVIPHEQSMAIAGNIDTFYSGSKSGNSSVSSNSHVTTKTGITNNDIKLNVTFETTINNDEDFKLSQKEYEDKLHQILQDIINGCPSGSYSY